MRNISYGNKKIDFLEKYIKLIVIIVYRYNTFRMIPTPSPCGKRPLPAFDPANDSKNRKLGDGSRSPVHLYYESCDCAACARVRACDRFCELERARGRHYDRKQEQMKRVMGHPAYDVASLLQDARVTVSDALEMKLLGQYLRQRRESDPDFDIAAFARAYARDFESDFAWEQKRVRAWEDDPFRAQMRARDWEGEYPYIPLIHWQHREHVKPEPNLRKRWRMYVDPVFPQFPSHPSWMHQQPLYPTPEFPYKPQHHKSQCR